MSTVTDLILTAELDVTDLDEVNKFFAEDPSYGEARMHKVDKPPGAEGKAVQADVYLGAFNGLDLSAFVNHLRHGPIWRDGRIDTVRLFVQQEHYEYGFREVEPWPELKRRR